MVQGVKKTGQAERTFQELMPKEGAGYEKKAGQADADADAKVKCREHISRADA